jgi:ABC-type sugar transport system permease subunit
MGNNSTQGLAVLVLLVAFTFLSISLFYGGSIVALLLALLTMGASITLFRKAKAFENQG